MKQELDNMLPLMPENPLEETLPSASMAGAGPLFTPGGFTAGGVPEIVTDQLPWYQVWATPVVPVK